MRVKMPPAVRIVQDTGQQQPDRGMRLLHREICCQGGTDTSPTGDVMTCRVCQRDFDPADFIRLIHHWAIKCSAEDTSSGPHHPAQLTPPGEDDCDGSATKRQLTAAAFIKQLTPPMNDRENLECAGPSPAPSCASSGSSSERKEPDEADERERKRPRVDAGANTTDSGLWSYVCFRCKDSFPSAWALVRHVQELHDVKIYVEDIASLRGSPAPSHSSMEAQHGDFSPQECPSPKRIPESKELEETELSALSPQERSESSVEGHGSGERDISRSRSPIQNNAFTLPERNCEVGCAENGDDGALTLDLSKPRKVSDDKKARNDGEDSTSLRRPPQSGAFCVENILSKDFVKPISDIRHSDVVEETASDGTIGSATPSAVPSSDKAHEMAASSSGERPRSCEFCRKEFRFQSNLVVHRRIHTGERPYKCRICSHACTQSSKLKRHMKTHVNENGGQFPNKAGYDDDTFMNDLRDESVSSPEGREVDDEEDERELNVQEEEIDDDIPQDLSTHRSKASPARSPVTHSRKGSKSPTDISTSVVGEVMDKFGLSSINTYRDAYRQALQESSKGSVVKAERSEDPTMDTEMQENPPPAAHQSAYDLTRKLQRDIASVHGTNASSLHGLWLPPLSLSGHLSLPPGLTSDLFKQAKEAADSMAASNSGRPLAVNPDYKLPGHMDALKLNGVSLEAIKLSSSLDAYKLATGLDAYRLPGGLDAYKLPGMVNPYKIPTVPDTFNLKSAPALANTTSSTSMASLPTSVTSTRRQRRDTCEYCGKVFKNGSNLTVHKRSHTGEKPYRCTMCNYACAQSSKLTRHMKTHGRSGKDVFQCRFCGMPFSVASTLEKHMRKCVVSKNNRAMNLPPVVPAGR